MENFKFEFKYFKCKLEAYYITLIKYICDGVLKSQIKDWIAFDFQRIIALSWYYLKSQKSLKKQDCELVFEMQASKFVNPKQYFNLALDLLN